MGVMLDSFRLAFPRGRAFDGIRDSSLVKAVGGQLETLREIVRKIPLEANPGRATYMLPEWHEALGKRYNSTIPIDEQRRRLEAARFVIGGMTMRQLQEQIDKEFEEIVISEIPTNSEAGVEECGVSYTHGVEGDYSTMYYDVAGTLDNDEQALHLAATLERFAPTHLVPCSSLNVLSASPTAETGVGTCGIEETGYSA